MLLFNSPLHCLRKTKCYRKLLESSFNQLRFYDLGFSYPIALRPITHASIWWNKKKLEPDLTKLFEKIIKQLDQKKENGCFYDIGANIGLYSWLCRDLSSNRTILAFEPDPKNFQLLQMTKENSKIKDINLFNIALSNRMDTVSFQQDTLTSATGMISDGQTPWIEKYLGQETSSIQVKTDYLDNKTFKTHEPSLIKIDVEGHELEVIKGGEKKLSQNKPLLLIESFPPNLDRVVNFLTKLGYKFWDSDLNKPLSAQTSNLFAWHDNGPLAREEIEKLIK
jgi:FkbM family methyltransferase